MFTDKKPSEDPMGLSLQLGVIWDCWMWQEGYGDQYDWNPKEKKADESSRNERAKDFDTSLKMKMNYHEFKYQGADKGKFKKFFETYELQVWDMFDTDKLYENNWSEWKDCEELKAGTLVWDFDMGKRDDMKGEDYVNSFGVRADGVITRGDFVAGIKNLFDGAVGKNPTYKKMEPEQKEDIFKQLVEKAKIDEFESSLMTHSEFVEKRNIKKHLAEAVMRLFKEQNKPGVGAEKAVCERLAEIFKEKANGSFNPSWTAKDGEEGVFCEDDEDEDD